MQGRGNEPLPNDLVKVLKTQDAGYIRTQKALEEAVRSLADALECRSACQCSSQLLSCCSLSTSASNDCRRRSIRSSTMGQTHPMPVRSTPMQTIGTPSMRYLRLQLLLRRCASTLFSPQVCRKVRCLGPSEKAAPLIRAPSGWFRMWRAARTGDPKAIVKKRSRSQLATTTPEPVAKKSRKAAKSVNVVDPAELEAEEAERKVAAAVSPLVHTAAWSHGSFSNTLQAHREALTTELAARKDRLRQFNRAFRELEVQRLLMGKGAKKALIPKKTTSAFVETDWKGDRTDGNNTGLPEAEEGISTGARVWVRGLSRTTLSLNVLLTPMWRLTEVEG